MFVIGEEFIEETEHNITHYIITRVENDYVYAKKIFNKEKNLHSDYKRKFSKKELIEGDTFASYWFKK